jgi:hypothetical protein
MITLNSTAFALNYNVSLPERPSGGRATSWSAVFFCDVTHYDPPALMKA